MNFYKTKKWRMKREAVLRRDLYQCRECRRYGRVTPAKIVHHVYPLEKHPEHKLNSHNLISLCWKCHEGMHNRDIHSLTEIGQAWVDRLKRVIEDGVGEESKTAD